MTALDQLMDWPVDHAAAAVLDRSGVRAVFGDQERPFALASLTKPLTALAALVAVSEGALELDTTLAEEPELAALVPEDNRSATLRHLLAHASGLAPDELSRAAAPGTRRVYSNAGFDLIGRWVERATELDFAEYLRQAVFEPLGVTDAQLSGRPASGATASVAAYTAVMAQLLTPGRLLHASTVAELSTVQFPDLAGVLPGYGRQPSNDWGLGFEVRDGKSPHWTGATNSARTYGHFGQSGTMFWIDPDRGLGLVALADRPFGDWAIQAWPVLSDAVLTEFG